MPSETSEQCVCINCCLRLHIMWCRGRFAQVDTITATIAAAVAMTAAAPAAQMSVIAIQTKAKHNVYITFEGGFGLCFLNGFVAIQSLYFRINLKKKTENSTPNLWKYRNNNKKFTYAYRKEPTFWINLIDDVFILLKMNAYTHSNSNSNNENTENYFIFLFSL